MHKLWILPATLILGALMFMGCEKGGKKEVIVHDTVYVEFDQFTYTATGLNDSVGDMVVFYDPNYPDEDGPRYELFWENWEYHNEIRLDEYVFLAFTTGTFVGLKINGELLGTSIPWTDEFGFEWQVVEIAYNTNKKSGLDYNRILQPYRKYLE